MTTYATQNNYVSQDAWEDDPVTDAVDDSAWDSDYETFDDDYAALEDDSAPYVEDDERDAVQPEEDQQEEEELRALECELEQALRNGDEDLADQVRDEMASLSQSQQAVKRPLVCTKTKRKTRWTPPPQFALPDISHTKDFTPDSTTWIQPTVVVDKSNPSVASSKKPLPARTMIRGPSPRKRFIHKEHEKPVVKETAKFHSSAPDGMTIVTRVDENLVDPVKKVQRPSSRFVKVGKCNTPNTFTINQDSWKKHNREQRRKYWQEKTKAAAESGDAAAKELIQRNKKREEAFDKLQNKSDEGSLKTQPCKAIMCGKKCKFGKRCKFAHTPDELTVRKCHFGSQCKRIHTCKFAHPADYDQKTNDAREKMASHLLSLIKK